MDGENNGKPYEQMDDLGGKPTIFWNIHLFQTTLAHASKVKMESWMEMRGTIACRTDFTGPLVV